MKQYNDLFRRIKNEGVLKNGVYSIFSAQARINLLTEFPMNAWFVKRELYSAIERALSILQGKNDVDFFGTDVRFWENPENHALIDQLSDIITQLRKNPDSRRIILSSWNAAEVAATDETPNVPLIQFYVATLKDEDRRKFWARLHAKSESYTEKMTSDVLNHVGVPRKLLSCQVMQAHADAIEIPNTGSLFATILLIVARLADMTAYELVHSFGQVTVDEANYEHLDDYIESEHLPMYRVVFSPSSTDIDSFSLADFFYSENE